MGEAGVVAGRLEDLDRAFGHRLQFKPGARLAPGSDVGQGERGMHREPEIPDRGGGLVRFAENLDGPHLPAPPCEADPELDPMPHALGIGARQEIHRP